VSGAPKSKEGRKLRRKGRLRRGPKAIVRLVWRCWQRDQYDCKLPEEIIAWGKKHRRLRAKRPGLARAALGARETRRITHRHARRWRWKWRGPRLCVQELGGKKRGESVLKIKNCRTFFRH
jgi:hypothetical protein